MTEAKNFRFYKRLINKQLLQVSGLYATLFLSYLPKHSMQIYRAQYGGRKSLKTSGTLFCYESDYFSLVS